MYAIGAVQLAVATMNISLPSELAKQVEDLVTTGQYGSASEVVRAGLRLLADHEAKRALLVRELQVGLDASINGRSGSLDFDQVIAESEARASGAKKESD
jgi:antitoxin ParD1/3/4